MNVTAKSLKPLRVLSKERWSGRGSQAFTQVEDDCIGSGTGLISKTLKS